MKLVEKILAGILTYSVVIVVNFLRIFVNGTISILNNFKTSAKCPPIKNDLLCIPATELAEKIRIGEILSKNVISAYIDRIKEVNPIVNAVIENRFTEALKEAEKVDEMIASTKYTHEELKTKFPLLGLPVTVKCSIAVKGMVFVGGRYFDNLEKRRAKEDSDVVRQVREAGGIILLISSCPELCKNIECFNKIIGTTRNPYDTRRTTGASSGGEAALLASGASLLGIGSDMGGSCRIPAAFCGVFGHRPTSKSISIEGHYPDSLDRERWNCHFVLGPMVRYSQDLPLLMSVICKPEMQKSLQFTQEVDITNLKIFYRFNNGGDPLTGPVDKNICKHLENVVKHFKSKGCYTEEVNFKYLNYSTVLSVTKLMSINDVDNALDNTTKNPYIEIIKSLLNFSNCALISLYYIIGKKVFDKMVPEKHLRLMDKFANELTASVKNTLKEDGVLIYPVTTGPAFYHGQALGKFLDITYTAIWNALGFPAVSCPIGLTEDGLPLAIQVIGNFNCDYLTFAVAREIEKSFGGWMPPPFTFT